MGSGGAAIFAVLVEAEVIRVVAVVAGPGDWFSLFEEPMLYPNLVLPALLVSVLPMPPAYVAVKCVCVRDGGCWKANTCCWEEGAAALEEGTCMTTITSSSTSSGVTVAAPRGDHGCSCALMTVLLLCKCVLLRLHPGVRARQGKQVSQQ